MNLSEKQSYKHRLYLLADLVCLNIEGLFEKLEINLRKAGKLYIGCCEIHSGDNSSALNIYPDGYKIRGYWRCNTRKCHEVFYSNIIGFTRGILSNRYYGWSAEHNDARRIAPFGKTVDWLCKLVNVNFNDLKVNASAFEHNEFANQIEAFRKIRKENMGVSRESIRKYLQIPAEYYLRRGYLANTLDRYDVGLQTAPNKEFSDRIVFPIYDDSGKYLVGATARSQYKCCAQCNTYHNPTDRCPTDCHNKRYAKWLHYGNASRYLYNFWFARSTIQQFRKVILTESPGNVLRLEEADIRCSLGMFGGNLSDEQQIILERSGATNVIVILDNDKAGLACKAKLRTKLGILYGSRLRFIVPSGGDVGEMSVDEIRKEIVPQLC